MVWSILTLYGNSSVGKTKPIQQLIKGVSAMCKYLVKRIQHSFFFSRKVVKIPFGLIISPSTFLSFLYIMDCNI